MATSTSTFIAQNAKARIIFTSIFEETSATVTLGTETATFDLVDNLYVTTIPQLFPVESKNYTYPVQGEVVYTELSGGTGGGVSTAQVEAIVSESLIRDKLSFTRADQTDLEAATFKGIEFSITPDAAEVTNDIVATSLAAAPIFHDNLGNVVSFLNIERMSTGAVEVDLYSEATDLDVKGYSVQVTQGTSVVKVDTLHSNGYTLSSDSDANFPEFTSTQMLIKVVDSTGLLVTGPTVVVRELEIPLKGGEAATEQNPYVFVDTNDHYDMLSQVGQEGLHLDRPLLWADASIRGDSNLITFATSNPTDADVFSELPAADRTADFSQAYFKINSTKRVGVEVDFYLDQIHALQDINYISLLWYEVQTGDDDLVLWSNALANQVSTTGDSSFFMLHTTPLLRLEIPKRKWDSDTWYYVVGKGDTNTDPASASLVKLASVLRLKEHNM